MKKTVYFILCTVMTTVIMVLSILPIFSTNRKLPQTQENFETMTADVLGSNHLLKEVYGAASRLLQPEAVFDDGNPIVRMPGGYLIQFHGGGSPFRTDWAADRIGGLKEFCAQRNIPVYYVSYPGKSTYTDSRPEDFGVMGDDKDQRAALLGRIRENGVPVLNLEDDFKARGFSQEEVFYKTDHHWKTEMGLLAAREIAEMLKTEASLEIYPELLTEDHFHARKFPKSWLGETGRKVSVAWVGDLDDYVFYEPVFETELEYHVPSAGINTEGGFSDIIDWSRFGDDTDLYDNSLHYVYMKDCGTITHIRNRKLTGANILLIKDSFSVPVMPFLALTCGNITWWDMRGNRYSVFDYIDRHRFDAVVIAYTDFWRSEMYDFK